MTSFKQQIILQQQQKDSKNSYYSIQEIENLWYGSNFNKPPVPTFWPIIFFFIILLFILIAL